MTIHGLGWERTPRVFGIMLCCSLWATAVAPAAEPTKGKWEVLFQGRRQVGQQPLPDDSSLISLTKLDIKGALTTDPYHLGIFGVDGDFGLNGGVLQRVSGKNAALQLIPEVGDFELEALINAESLGGWFWLLGWKDGHGYTVYNVTLKTSGSPWLVGEFRGDQGIRDTLREFHRLAWKGPQVLRMSVVDSRLNLQVGTARLATDLELPNYHPGALILGTYDTPYGPRNLRIQSIRYRPVTVKSP